MEDFTPVHKIKVAHMTMCEKSDRGMIKRDFQRRDWTLSLSPGLGGVLGGSLPGTSRRRTFGLSPGLGGVFGGYWLEGWEGVRVEADDSLLRGLPFELSRG